MHDAHFVLLVLKLFTFKNDLMVKLSINKKQVLAKQIIIGVLSRSCQQIFTSVALK